MDKIQEILRQQGITANITVQEKQKDKKKTFDEIIKEYGLNDKQVEYYKKYSMERSRYAYEKIAAKELSETDLVKDWEYAGYYDAGYRGADYCSAGHALRYVHIARNKNTGKEIKFGIICVREFFKLTDIQIKFLKNGFAEANKEIEESLNRCQEYNNDWDKYEEEHHFALKLDYVLNTDASKLYFSSDEFEHLLKIAELKQLLKLKLFLPDFFERRIKWAFDTLSKPKTYIYPVIPQGSVDSIQNVIQSQDQDENNIIRDNPGNIVNYLLKNHLQAYEVIKSLTLQSKKQNLSEKQTMLMNKILSTPWEDIDDIAEKVKNKQLKLNSYLSNAYYNILESCSKYGCSEKQYKLLRKAVGLK